MSTAAARTPKIGLALGSGSARGWAHLGVLQALRDARVQPDVVCGASVGALVAAVYASRELDRFTDWALSLDRRKVFQFMDFRWSGGMLKGEKLMAFLRQHFTDCGIDGCHLPFAAVATDLYSGAEVWLRQGSLVDAVRASIALPGLFTPVAARGRWLVDGGLVNPVPVSLARAMGADIVIAVDLNADIMRRRTAPVSLAVEEMGEDASAPTSRWWQKGWRSWRAGTGETEAIPPAVPTAAVPESEMPSVLDVAMNSVNIMQMRITRSRLAGDPPELLIAPRLAHLGLMDFHRAEEAIEAGRHAALLELPELVNFY